MSRESIRENCGTAGRVGEYLDGCWGSVDPPPSGQVGTAGTLAWKRPCVPKRPQDGGVRHMADGKGDMGQRTSGPKDNTKDVLFGAAELRASLASEFASHPDLDRILGQFDHRLESMAVQYPNASKDEAAWQSAWECRVQFRQARAGLEEAS